MTLRLYVILALVLVCCIGCSLDQGSQSTTEPLPVQNDDLPPTATLDPLLATMAVATIPPLATYQSSTYRYSFSYSATSQLEEEDSGQTVWLDKQILIRVSDTNPEDALGDGPVIESADSTFINGQAARRLAGYIGGIGGNTPQRYQSIAIPFGGRFYIITAYELRNDAVQSIERTMGDIPLNTLSLFDLVIGTFIVLS
jgi:hypothetical protein